MNKFGLFLNEQMASKPNKSIITKTNLQYNFKFNVFSKHFGFLERVKQKLFIGVCFKCFRFIIL